MACGYHRAWGAQLYLSLPCWALLWFLDVTACFPPVAAPMAPSTGVPRPQERGFWVTSRSSPLSSLFKTQAVFSSRGLLPTFGGNQG